MIDRLLVAIPQRLGFRLTVSPEIAALAKREGEEGQAERMAVAFWGQLQHDMRTLQLAGSPRTPTRRGW